MTMRYNGDYFRVPRVLIHSYYAPRLQGGGVHLFNIPLHPSFTENPQTLKFTTLNPQALFIRKGSLADPAGAWFSLRFNHSCRHNGIQDFRFGAQELWGHASSSRNSMRNKRSNRFQGLVSLWETSFSGLFTTFTMVFPRRTYTATLL